MSDEIEVSSEAVKSLRKKLSIATNLFYAIGQMPVKAAEAKGACEILDYVDALVKEAQDELNSQLAVEMLGRPVKVEGTTLSLAPESN